MSAKPQMMILDGDGSFQIEVVGESRYRANLLAIAGDGGGAGVDLVLTAYMVPEPGNPNDRNAVRVDIDQKPVGYLRRELAAVLSPALRANRLVALQAQAHITAGFDGGNYSVWLDGDLAEIMQMLTGMQATKRKRRVPWWAWAVLLVLAGGCGCIGLSNATQR